MHPNMHRCIHTYMHTHQVYFMLEKEREVLKPPRPRCATEILETRPPDSCLCDTGITQIPVLGFQTRKYIRIARESQVLDQ